MAKKEKKKQTGYIVSFSDERKHIIRPGREFFFFFCCYILEKKL